MKHVILFLALLLSLSSPQAFANSNTADRLISALSAVTSLSCDVRRTVKTDDASLTFLSRVFFTAGNRLHVQNIQPLPRRIVCDGTTFFSYIDGDAKGFSRPVTNLTEDMLLALQKVPGTAMDHLLRLRNIPEDVISPTRSGYSTKAGYVTLDLDESNRLCDVRFFESKDLTKETAHYHYERFEEPIPGISIPTLHTGSITLNGIKTEEMTLIEHLSINQPIAESLFAATTFFPNVEFSDNFEATLQQE